MENYIANLFLVDDYNTVNVRKLWSLPLEASKLLYSQKIWRGIKFGGLAVCMSNCQIKIRQNFLLAYIHMAIPYRTAKFKSANTFAMAIWDPTAKFSSRQYFWLYGTEESILCSAVYASCTIIVTVLLHLCVHACTYQWGLWSWGTLMAAAEGRRCSGR